MIKSLEYSVTFPTNGISLNGSYAFEPGLTAVTGGNGSGKTFGTIEMIRYMLFGKRALRGPASDYKTLKAVMVVEIVGEDYTVERNSKTESLKDAAGETLAVGAEAVNTRLQALLGMSLDVFDVVCAAVQKESDRLSKLQPAARKKLIDETVGLNANEAVEKDCKDEAKGLIREADALRSSLVVPIDPVIPEGYQPSDVLGEQLRVLKAALEERRQLQSIIDRAGLPPAVPPLPTFDLVELEQHEQDRLSRDAAVAAAERQLKTLPEAIYTAEQLDASERLLAYREEVARRGEGPKLTLEQVEEWEEFHRQLDISNRMESLEVSCPSCTTKFCPGHSPPASPEGDYYTAAALREQRAALQRWDTPITVTLTCYAEELTAAQIAAGRQALTQGDLRADLVATTWLPELTDRSADLAMARREKAAEDAYAEAYKRWVPASVDAALAETQLDNLPPVDPTLIKDLDQRFVEACIYESQLLAWTDASENYRVALEAIEDRVTRAEDFKLGAKRLAETRQKFKSHLAPTLSWVASSLISEMTGGVLSSVIVDEDMNITVNGQDIATLSGAGSTVANLALRIALGQVLVRGVLPVFLADEADSDMEAARAEYTMECMANLSEKLRQVIVITHKPVKFTDQVITLQSNDSIID